MQQPRALLSAPCTIFLCSVTAPTALLLKRFPAITLDLSATLSPWPVAELGEKLAHGELLTRADVDAWYHKYVTPARAQSPGQSTHLPSLDSLRRRVEYEQMRATETEAASVLVFMN